MDEKKLRDSADLILKVGLQSVDPYHLINQQIKRQNNTLFFQDGLEVDLDNYKTIRIIGIGKGVAPMAKAMEDLLQEKNVQHIDLLVTDTEGYDARVLEHFDLERYMPSLIIYESVHLSHSESKTLSRRFRAAGYQLHEVAGNVVAFQSGCFPGAPVSYNIE